MRRDLDSTLESFFSGLDSANSRRGYRQVWDAFVAWLKKRSPLKVKPIDVQEYIVSLRDAGKADSTRAWTLSALRSIYDALTVNGFVSSNPARSVKNPKTSHAPKAPWLEEEGVAKLLQVLDGTSWRDRRNRLCVLLFLGLGWRRSEVARMRAEDFQGGTVTGIVKGRKLATAGVPEWLRDEIRAWLSYAGFTAGPLLPRGPEVHEQISGDTVYNIVVAVAELAGLKVTPHALRRTFITVLRERGVGLKELQGAVAHSSSATTERYDRKKSIAAPGEKLEDLVKRK